jgi:hypothetical protein
VNAVHAASAILWKADILQAWDRDYGAISHLVPVEVLQFLSQQMRLEGTETTRIGPSPDDFEDAK